MSLLNNPDYQILKNAYAVVGRILSLVETQDLEISDLRLQIGAGLQASEAEISLRLRAELKTQFDTAFTDSLALIGASSQQLQFIRDSLVGELPVIVEQPVNPDLIVIPNL
jgi:hypothetical protein